MPLPLLPPSPPSPVPPSVLPVSPTAATTPRITRSNSIPTHEAAFALYSGSQMGSTLSLAERPKGMIRSGSFRDPADDGETSCQRGSRSSQLCWVPSRTAAATAHMSASHLTEHPIGPFQLSLPVPLKGLGAQKPWVAPSSPGALGWSLSWGRGRGGSVEGLCRGRPRHRPPIPPVIRGQDRLRGRRGSS